MYNISDLSRSPLRIGDLALKPRNMFALIEIYRLHVYLLVFVLRLLVFLYDGATKKITGKGRGGIPDRETSREPLF